MRCCIYIKYLLLGLIVVSTSTLIFYVGVNEPNNLVTDSTEYSFSGVSEESEYLERQKHLNKMCKNVNNEYVHDMDNIISQKELLEHILVDSKHKILYCYVPKVACTNWKRIMLLLLGMVETDNLFTIPSDVVHRQHVIPSLINFTVSEIKHMLRTHKKFIFVRHPFERLLSAYRNKFEQHYNSSKYFQTRFGRLIVKQFRVNASSRSLMTGDDVTFKEFIDFIISKNTIFNEHWKPVNDLCRPCLIKYDFIGKYESLYDDSDFLLSRIGVQNVTFPRVQKGGRSSMFLKNYLPQLSFQTLDQLYKLYYYDFKVFNYNVQEYLGYEMN